MAQWLGPRAVDQLAPQRTARSLDRILWPDHAYKGTFMTRSLCVPKVCIRSSDPASAGYFLFYCHLQKKAIVQALVPNQAVTTSTPVGVMGDTGNAAGTPQLHAEIHYPIHATYTCTRCTRPKTVTAIDPYASLAQATLR